MPKSKVEKGREGELIASRFLSSKGFEIIARNFRIDHKEIDIIAREGEFLVFVEVKLDRTTKYVFEAFARAATRAPEVMECHMVAGGFDYLVKTRVKDMAAYRAFLSDVLLGLPGVRETHTYAVMEEVKVGTDLPI